MTLVLHPGLRCPIEASHLKFNGVSLVFKHGHRFDVARQGYVNLLGPKDKRSKDPGDSEEMVSARTAILGANFYHPLADACLDITLECCPGIADDQITLIDAGFGDGYYLHYIKKELLNNKRKQAVLVGFDISKRAV